MDALTTEPHTPSATMQRAHGRVEVDVYARNGQTALQRLVQDGCAKARLPKLGNRTCEQVVLINSSGGITGGDRLAWTVRVGEGAHFTSTSQACEKVYAAKAQDMAARVTTCIEIGEGASLNWLPQETILFDGAKLHRTIDASMAANSRLLMVEPVAFGRRAMGEAMASGRFCDQWRIHRGGELVHAEGFEIGGTSGAQLTPNFAMKDNAAMATLALFAPDAEERLERLNQLLAASADVMAAATAWNGKLIARMVSIDSYHLRRTLVPAIAQLTDGEGVPKVWAL
ncbi:MAG: urease accessory protein UreD [Pseudomonadota bacterium]